MFRITCSRSIFEQPPGFPSGSNDVAHGGAKLYAGVIRDSAGNLFGTTEDGGNGVVFKRAP